MDKQLVGELPDITQSSNENEIMVITDAKYNQLRKEKISDFLTDMISKDETNALIKGADNKLFVTNFGNADNITSGTIDKDRLPAIEVGDLPDSGVLAKTYPYPVNLQVNQKGQVVSVEAGEPGGNNANTDLSNLTETGEKHFLNKTQITNCILEAPNGAASFEGTIITVKSGIKYLTGSGRNVDRTLKNTENTLNDDKTINFASIGSGSNFAVVYIYNNTANYCPASEVYRTSTKPVGNTLTNQIWFDEVNNKVYYSAYQTEGWTETTDLAIVATINVTDATINTLIEEQPVEFVKRSNTAWITNSIAPDFSNIVNLPMTVNLVQQLDDDCYLEIGANSGTNIDVVACDVNGEILETILSCDTVSAQGSHIISPLLKKGLYFKASRVDQGTPTKLSLIHI